MPQHSHAPALLILNGKGAGNEELRQAVKRLRAEQITLYVRVTGARRRRALRRGSRTARRRHRRRRRR